MGITLSWAFWHTSISFIFVFLSVAMMALESGLPIPMFSGWSWSWVNWDEMSEWEQVLRWLPQLTSLTAAVLALLATTFCGGGRDRRGTRRLFSEPILAIAGILAALSLPLVAMHLYMMIVPLGFSLCCCFPKQCPNLDRDLLNSEVCQNHMLGHHGEGFVCKLRSWELALASVGPPLLLMACTYVAAFVAVTLSRDDEEGKGSTNRRRGGRRRGKRGRRRGGRSGEGRRGGGDQEVNDGYASADDESDEYSSGRSESGSERSHSDSGSFRGTDHSESDEEEEGEEDGRRSLETRQIELTSFASRARAAATGRLPDGTLVKASKAGWKRPHVGRVRGWDAVVEMYIVEFDAGIRRQVRVLLSQRLYRILVGYN